MISFVLKLKGDERIDGDDLLSFLYHYYEGMQVNGVVHEVKLMSVGNDEIVKMASLYSII